MTLRNLPSLWRKARRNSVVKEKWWIRFTRKPEVVDDQYACLHYGRLSEDYLFEETCWHPKNPTNQGHTGGDCSYKNCPLAISDERAGEYWKDVAIPVKCKHYDGGGYCKTDNPPPAVIPVKCGGDANKCSLDPPIILRIWNLIYWRRR